MKHSLKLNLKPVKCFAYIKKTGLVMTGHCECMAGLGEVCRHIGALLFVLEAWGRKSEDIENAVRSRQNQCAVPECVVPLRVYCVYW